MGPRKIESLGRGVVVSKCFEGGYVGRVWFVKLPTKHRAGEKDWTVFLVKAAISKSRRQLNDWSKERWRRRRVRRIRGQVSRSKGDIRFLMFVSRSIREFRDGLRSGEALLVEADGEKMGSAYRWLVKQGFTPHFDGEVIRYIYLAME